MEPILLLLALAAAPPSVPPPEAGPEVSPTDVNALIEGAIAGHPDVEAANQRIEALGHAIPQAWVWPDAMVATEYSNMPVLAPWPGNHPMSGIQLKVSQTVPFPYKFWARAGAAEAVRDAAVPMKDEAANQIAGRVHMLVVQWRLSRALRGVTERHLEAAEQLLDAVRVKYELGRVEQHDLIRLEVLRDKLADDLVELDRRRDAIAAALNAAAQREPGAPLQLGSEIPIPDAAELDVVRLVEVARQNRPVLAALRGSATAERAQASAMRSEKWPDVTAWAGYRVRLPAGADPGNNFLTAGVSVPIPWASALWKWEEKAQAHEARARSEDARRQGVELNLRGELDAAVVRYQRAIEKSEVYGAKLIPGAQKTLEAAFGSYQVDRAGFAELFSAELTVLEYERAELNARAEAATAAIAIDMLTGRFAPSGEKDTQP